MSWGERSCSRENAPKHESGGCAIAEMHTCNVNCEKYTWDGKTKPDSMALVRHETLKEKIKKADVNYRFLSKNQKKKLRKKLRNKS